MFDPKIKTKVVHSESNAAWNVVGISLGGKHKIARVPYVTTADSIVNETEKKEALEHAEFISWCFNHSDGIIARQHSFK